MKLNSRFLFGVLSIAMAAVIAFIAIPMANRQANGRTDVLRITRHIYKGEIITEQHIEIIPVGTYNMPAGIVKAPENVIGKYANTDLYEGDFILESKLADEPLNSEFEEVPSGKLAVSLTIKTLASGVSNKLKAGDIIRIYYYRDYAREIPELQYVRVLYVTDPEGLEVNTTPVEDTGIRSTAAITVIASNEQAAIITGIENDGIAHVALICRGDNEIAGELLEIQDTILDEILNPPDEEHANPDTDALPSSQGD